MTEIVELVSERMENIVEKGGNAGNLFSQCFSEAVFV